MASRGPARVRSLRFLNPTWPSLFYLAWLCRFSALDQAANAKGRQRGLRGRVTWIASGSCNVPYTSRLNASAVLSALVLLVPSQAVAVGFFYADPGWAYAF